ncbi:hypothetical protein [Photobacterium leiognathi]|uniref:hypothetical protein n=1 Tax=Photobacterium leiognathi TaxID=553611 RepID=UPI002739B9BD|nr:hypothetical protein [Photobacterium leiognathi]
MKLIKMLLLLLGLIFTHPLSATVISRTFTPNVTIFNNSHSDGLEIVAPQKDFVLLYDSDRQTFHDLKIPFDVVSKKGTVVDYKLSLPIIEGSCILGDDSENIVLDIYVNDNKWDGDGLPFSGVRNSHVMTIAYPNLEQKNIDQKCFGIIGVQVESVVL